METSCGKASAEDFRELKKLFTDDHERRLRQLEDGVIDIFYVECDGRPVGRLIANYTNQHLENETCPGVRANLSHFILFREYRNRGLGGELLAFALRELRSRGYGEFTVGVEAENHIAKHLYEKHGFTEIIAHGSDPCEYDLYLLNAEPD